MKKRGNWIKLVICLVSVYAIAFIGGLFTSSSVNSDWYESVKPSITPPSYVFPIVWNILFFLIGLSLYISYSESKNKSKIIFLFSINLFLNVFWSFLYFQMKNPLFAFIDLIFIWISILVLIINTHKINKTASYLLIPYLLWVSFAAILNWMSI